MTHSLISVGLVSDSLPAQLVALGVNSMPNPALPTHTWPVAEIKVAETRVSVLCWAACRVQYHQNSAACVMQRLSVRNELNRKRQCFDSEAQTPCRSRATGSSVCGGHWEKEVVFKYTRPATEFVKHRVILPRREMEREVEREGEVEREVEVEGEGEREG